MVEGPSRPNYRYYIIDIKQRGVMFRIELDVWFVVHGQTKSTFDGNKRRRRFVGDCGDDAVVVGVRCVW